MNALTWHESLALQQPRMDQTHREFVDLLQDLGAAVDAGATDIELRLADLLRHTEAHFAQEERWLRDIGFAAENCHAAQHGQVLKVLGEVAQSWRDEANRALIRVLVQELGNWFVAHAKTMDAGLAQLMAEQGYDPDTGIAGHPRDPLAAALTGCGSAACS